MIDTSQRETPSNALFDIASSREHDATPFPLLTQGDHPVLGTPCWYLHPCETSTAISEILAETIGDTWDDSSEENHSQCLVKWLEAWFLVVSSVLDLSEGV
jgi:ubiquitin-like-conjugating enzyme ATG10